MNNPNPFVPKGSLLEQQSQRRSRLKLAVFCVLAVSVTGLVAMLIQGCKRENPDQNNNLTLTTDTNPPPMQFTNAPDTNPPVPMAPVASNPPPAMIVPPPVQPTPPPAAPVEAAGSEYVVVQGDTLAKIAKAHGVSVNALKAANPTVDPKKLKIKSKLVIPAAPAPSAAAPAAGAAATDVGSDVYVVKSGDTLGKIAKAHGTSVKALQAANSLSTTKIKVGDKLKLPAKTETAPAAAPATDATAAPAAAPSTPAPGR